jgi:hypothetical protein
MKPFSPAWGPVWVVPADRVVQEWADPVAAVRQVKVAKVDQAVADAHQGKDLRKEDLVMIGPAKGARANQASVAQVADPLVVRQEALVVARVVQVVVDWNSTPWSGSTTTPSHFAANCWRFPASRSGILST